MYQPGIREFKYFVGISSLSQIATRDDRVCVLNILGGESSEVTPVGHAWSGGNVVFGTSPGRRGQTLATPLGDIPVYNSVREGLDAGHRFNCGVVYLPPAAARDGVAELIRVNPELRKVFIITEKISVHDAREIRAMAQQHGIDVFGANCLGVADAWNQVRIGGALGGDHPGDTLRPGSIAILSNSGGFTTTIAQYLRLAGWGTTTSVSSGKDVYIHYAAPEFAFALANDARSKAAVLYCEPGGYYEREANFTKPVVACVVGRWKGRLTRAVGHAGAMAGGDDDAAAKEAWFMEKFGVDGIYTPERPVFSARGAVVTNIAHIPAALTAVMRANATLPDFAPEGTMELKPWFAGDAGLKLSPALALPTVVAPSPYGDQIAQLARQVGALFPRQPMKDASGASRLDPATQVASLHGVSVLDAATRPLEANVCFALLRDAGSADDHALLAATLGALVGLAGDPALAAAQAARAAGSSPNAVLAGALCAVGPSRAEAARRLTGRLIDAYAAAGFVDAHAAEFAVPADPALDAALACTEADGGDEVAALLLAAVGERGARSVFIDHLRRLPVPPSLDAVLAAVAATIGWDALVRKRVARGTVENLPWWLQCFAVLVGATAPAARHTLGAFCGVGLGELAARWRLAEIAGLALLGQRPDAGECASLETLLGLLLTNGPGTISAQGAKGAVAADGPEEAGRVQINKALVGFLTHTGFAHGGNGYEGVAFLLERFAGRELDDPTSPDHGIDLKAMALEFAAAYATDKAARKAAGVDVRKLPGINHPVFKDQPVNTDPREAFLRERMAARGEYNVFHAFYREFVQALFDAGVSRNVYCVNIDAVIAAQLLRLAWRPLHAGTLSSGALEDAAFTLFLHARMLGCAAEIEDHTWRGRNMDTRTPASRCQHVA